MPEDRQVQAITLRVESVVLTATDFDWLMLAVHHNEQLTQDVHRLSMRCAALACLLYPNPDAMPRQAMPGDI